MVLVPAQRREVRGEGVGVRRVVSGRGGGGGGSGVRLMRVVMVELVVFVFALLVPLFAARSLLLLRRHAFLPRFLGALHASSSPAAATSSSPTARVRLSAAGAQWVTGGGPGQRRKAVIGGEERGLGRKASQVKVIFLSFIEAVLSVETVAMVIEGTHGEEGRGKAS